MAASNRAGRNRLTVVACAAVCLFLAGATHARAAFITISWASNPESDVTGYRLHYGTTPDNLDQVSDTGLDPTATVLNLDAGQDYYFAVTAMDLSGNESEPSSLVHARVPLNLEAPPSVRSVVEVATHSVYAVRSAVSTLLVSGRHLQNGARFDFGPGVLVFGTSMLADDEFQLRTVIWPSAGAGTRTLTVTNPDDGVGGLTESLEVVQTPDMAHDCLVDAIDLNALARAWNSASGEARYDSACDLDGDQYVGPLDLTIFVRFLNRKPPGCP